MRRRPEHFPAGPAHRNEADPVATRSLTGFSTPTILREHAEAVHGRGGECAAAGAARDPGRRAPGGRGARAGRAGGHRAALEDTWQRPQCAGGTVRPPAGRARGGPAPARPHSSARLRAQGPAHGPDRFPQPPWRRGGLPVLEAGRGRGRVLAPDRRRLRRPPAAVIRIAEPVRRALAEDRPVVALESSLIAHGLPRPANLETALAMEAAVRDGGAVPATIGVVGGQPTVGLADAELELLATHPEVAKASTGDLAVLMARGAHGATTVAATLVPMDRAGLRVLATGGIGGAHRGAEATFDISADLTELARRRALVACSGAKAILDLARTLELLETLGVPVLGLQTDELPAFFATSSGLPVTARVADAAEAAAIAR